MTLEIGNKIRLKQDTIDKEFGRYKKNTYIVSDVRNGKIRLKSTNGQKNAPMFVDECQIVRVEYNENDNNPLPVQEVVIKKYITSDGKTFSQKASAEAHELSIYKNKLIDKILKELKLTETELRQIINRANIIKPRNLQIHKLAHTTFLSNLNVEDIKHVPEVVNLAKSIVSDQTFKVFVKLDGELVFNKEHYILDDNWKEFELPKEYNSDDYKLEQKEINEERKEIIFNMSTVAYDEDELQDIELTDEELMQALEFGGVDNWNYYDESISNFRDEYDIPEDETLSPEDKLYALQIGGVDNWTYYSDSIENYIKEYKNQTSKTN